jgi:tol-pal system protein YbgF
MASMLAPSRACLLLAVALTAGPAFAQKQSLADRVARLEQQSATQGSSASQSNVELLNRLTQMQAEVQALRNQVETLQNENEQLKQHDRDQYVDLDTRLQRIEGGAAAPSAAAPRAASSAPAAASPGRPSVAAAIASPPPRAVPPGATSADDQSAYSAAFDALKRGDYVESARAFQAYLHSYPQAPLAPNAWYWLGESYYVTQNYPVALQSFETLLSQFPDSAKAPDALLKKGYCEIELGQAGAGQKTLNRVINDYPGTDAARLATSRLRALSLETH